MIATLSIEKAAGIGKTGAADRLVVLLRRVPCPRVYYRALPVPTRPEDAGGSGQGLAPAPRLLLTVPEACAVLRVSRWTLYRLIQTRQLETIKIGSRRCVPVASIQALINQLSDREAA